MNFTPVLGKHWTEEFNSILLCFNKYYNDLLKTITLSVLLLVVLYCLVFDFNILFRTISCRYPRGQFITEWLIFGDNVDWVVSSIVILSESSVYESLLSTN